MPKRYLHLESLQQFAAVTVLSDPGAVPGPKIIPNAAMVRLNWTLADGRIAHNVLYATYTGSPALSVTVAEAIRTGLTSGASWTSYADFLHPNASLASVTLLDVRSNTGVEINSTGPGAAGTSTGSNIPDEAALVMTLRTNNRGPSGRGRFYLCGYASNAVGNGGVIHADLVVAASAWAGGLIPATISQSIGPMVLGLPHRQAYTSPITGREFPDRPATTVPVQAIICRDNHWDSQRRRGLR